MNRKYRPEGTRKSVKDAKWEKEGDGPHRLVPSCAHRGNVAAGMPVLLLDCPHPEWTIARVNEIIHDRHHPATAALAACPLLNAGLRNRFAKRAKISA